MAATAVAKALSTDFPARISVIVPAYNNSLQLSRCLAGLCASKCQPYEIVVVDDCSTEDLRGIVARYGARYVRTDFNMGPAGARNLGVEIAAGDIVWFVDSDVVVAPDALERIEAVFAQDSDTAAVFGSYDDQPFWPDLVSRYKNLSHHYYHQIANKNAVTFWAGCGAVRKNVFQQLRGFDANRYKEPSIEDIELGFRIKEAGWKIRLDSDIQAKHLKRWSLWNMVRTDVFCRAVPWTRLIIQTRELPNDLNLRTSSRLSGALVAVLALVVALLPLALASTNPQGVTWYLLGGLVGLVMILLGLNWDMYRWFFRRHGIGFTACAVLLHWLYYFYSGIAFVACTVVHRLVSVTPRPAVLDLPLRRRPDAPL